MNWLRKITRDNVAIDTAAHEGNYADFMAVYSPADTQLNLAGHSLLASALTNANIDARLAIANQLLNDSALVTGYDNPLIAYMTTNNHDFNREVPLLQRVIAGGVDLNKPVGRWETPLFALAAMFRFKETQLSPFYDVFFAQPNLDFGVICNVSKDSQYRAIEKISELRPNLLQRTNAYLARHNLTRPADAKTQL